MAYIKQTWQDAPSTTTPINATRLNYIENGIASLTKADFGLSNVDNTSDLNKPLSTAASSAIATKVSQGSIVIDIGDYNLPSPGIDATAALTAAYAATPTGGVLSFGNRNITLNTQFTVNKKITFRGGTLICPLYPAFNVTASDVTLDHVQINRTGGGHSDRSGCAVLWSAPNGLLDECVISSSEGPALGMVTTLANGTRVLGGSYSSSNTDSGSEVIIATSGSGDNKDIVVDGVKVRHTGYGSGISLYSASGCTVRNCDVRGIRASPWYNRTNGDWTLFSGSVWRTVDRTDVQSNSVYVGDTSGTWLATKVAYLEGTSTALSAGQYLANGDGFLYLRMADSSDPNLKYIRTRRTDGYGILFYSTTSAVNGIADNLVAENYVSDTDGFGIYLKAGQGTPKGNATFFNTLEDVCKLGVAVASLPFSGFGVLATETITMVGDIVRRAGTSDFPVPNFKFLHDDSHTILPKVQAFGLRSEQSSSTGFLLSKGYFEFNNCTALESAGTGFAIGTQVAGNCYITLNNCNAIGNGTVTASNGASFTGTTMTTRVSIIGGRYSLNTLRGIQFTSCIDSKIIGVTCESNTQQGINIGTCTGIFLSGNMMVGDEDIAVDSGTTGLTHIPGSEGTGTTITIGCTNWRIGDNYYTGTGSPQSVLTAPVGSVYARRDGGTDTTLYVKETGTGNTGWIANAAASPIATPTFDYLSTLGSNPFMGMAVQSSSMAVGTANLGFAVMVRPSRNLTLNFLDWFVGATSAGNYDIGIYDAAGTTKLWSKGSTAWPTISTTVNETVSPAVSLVAGTTYRVIISGDNTTATVRGFSFLSGQGRLSDGTYVAVNVGSAFPLGSSINLAGTQSSKIPLVILRET